MRPPKEQGHTGLHTATETKASISSQIPSGSCLTGLVTQIPKKTTSTAKNPSLLSLLCILLFLCIGGGSEVAVFKCRVSHLCQEVVFPIASLVPALHLPKSDTPLNRPPPPPTSPSPEQRATSEAVTARPGPTPSQHV